MSEKMTAGEAANILGSHYDGTYTAPALDTALWMGYSALRLQIPKVPLAPGAIFDFTCPHCGSRDYLKNEDSDRNKFCGQCGQAIDWSEVYDE